jgi:hypothetical protein
MSIIKKIIWQRVLGTFAILGLLMSCQKEVEVVYTGTPPEPTIAATDYSQLSHWLNIPATVYPVDIFYLYPTSWSNSDSLPVICAIDDTSMLRMAPQSYARQATAFETVGNVYAPFYRQYNNSNVNRMNGIAGIPTTDGIAAFDYYIKNFNHGRPYIIVSHSQGSNVASSILSSYMAANPEVYSRMIAAYVIGFPITEEYLAVNPHLKFAKDSVDLGVIISYNTEGSLMIGTNPVLYGLVGKVINPINWRTDQTIASKTEGLGSLIPQPPKFAWTEVPQYADAQCDTTKGILVCSTADEVFIGLLEISQGIPVGIYHPFDIPFYYKNLRKNASDRVAAYMAKKHLDIIRKN